MNKIVLNKDTHYTIDLKGVAIINTNIGINMFLEYPEAAVWSILTGTNNNKTTEMLMSILKKNKEETCSYIEECIIKWKKQMILD